MAHWKAGHKTECKVLAAERGERGDTQATLAIGETSTALLRGIRHY